MIMDVQQHSQKRKASDISEDGDLLTHVPLKESGSLKVFDFKSPSESSSISIDENSPSIPIIPFYKSSQKNRPHFVTRNALSAAKQPQTKDTNGSPRPSKRLRHSSKNDSPTTRSMTVSDKVTVSNSLARGKVSTPNNRRGRTWASSNINEILTAVTSDSPTGKLSSESSGSENEDPCCVTIASENQKLARKELFSVVHSPKGKSSPRKTKLNSPGNSLDACGSPKKKFFKSKRIFSSSNKTGKKRANVSVGRGFNLTFTPHGQQSKLHPKTTCKSEKNKKAPKIKFRALEFASHSHVASKIGNAELEAGHSHAARRCQSQNKQIPVDADSSHEARDSVEKKSCGDRSVAVGQHVLKEMDNQVNNEKTASGTLSCSQKSEKSSHGCRSVDLFSNSQIGPSEGGFNFDNEDRAEDRPTVASDKTRRENAGSDGASENCSNTSVVMVSSKGSSGLHSPDGSPSQKSQKKLFPFFGQKPQSSPKQVVNPFLLKELPPSVSPSSANVRSRLNDVKEDLEQYALDLGQKDTGTTQCPACGMVYTLKEPSDEAHHSKFHKKMMSALKYQTFKKRSIVKEYPNGTCIVQVLQGDQQAQMKVDDILAVVDEDLGFLEVVPKARKHKKTFLYVSEQKKVVGVCVAEAITQAYPVLTDSQRSVQLTQPQKQRAWCCSVESVPAKCGISRIWVFRQERRKGIATQLLDCVRFNFFLGYPLEKSELAFTDPTPDGKEFAATFTGGEHFLVYK